MRKSLKIAIAVLAVVFLLVACFTIYFFVGKPVVNEKITWGVDFSQSHAEYLGLDWKKLYLDIIDDLGVKEIKLHTNWNWVEGKKDDFYFKDIDWQISQAERNNVKIVYILGLKTGRWPECHAPSWVLNMQDNSAKEELLDYIKQVVLRYKDSKAISFWQVENEPFFKFGKCPEWYYSNKDFLKQEVNLVKELNSSRKVIISDSGELSLWFKAAKNGDIVGTTMYRSAWGGILNNLGINLYKIINPTFYARKAKLVEKFYNKEVICVELQAEPWLNKSYKDAPLENQLKSMNPEIFTENIEFAKKTGFDTFYLWGVEWWYWLKETQNYPQMWNTAKLLFNEL